MLVFFFYITSIDKSRYLDGERLDFEDEKIIMEKLLPFHPYAKDKIGCGLDFIMVRYFSLPHIRSTDIFFKKIYHME